MFSRELLVAIVILVAVPWATAITPAAAVDGGPSAAVTPANHTIADVNLTSGATRWKGQILFLQSAHPAADAGAVYQIRNASGGTVGALVTEIPLDEHGKALLHTAVIPAGEYVIVDETGTPIAVGPDGIVRGPADVSNATWELVVQSLNATIRTGPTLQGRNATLRIVSNRGRYPVIVTAPELSGPTLTRLFDGTALDTDGDTTVDSIRLRATAFDTRSIRIPQALDPGSYTLQLTVPDTSVTTEVTLKVREPERTAAFGTAAIQEERGDIASITVELTNTRTATLRIGARSLDYRTTLTVRDGNGDGRVAVRMNTYLAGRLPNGSETAAFTTVADTDTITAVRRHTARRETPLAAADYPLRVVIDGRETDTATLILTNRSLQGIDTLVMPRRAAADTPAKIVDAARSRDRIALGDTLVIRVKASGLSGVLNSSYNLGRGSASAATHGVFITLEQANTTGPSPGRVNMSAASLVMGQNTDTVYVVIETANRDAFGGLHADETYEVRFVVDETSPLTRAGVSESINTSFTIVERRATIITRGDRLDVQLQPGITGTRKISIKGKTTVAPGTKLLVTLRSNADPPFFKNTTVTVQKDGTWEAHFRFTDPPPAGTRFTVKVRDGVTVISQRVAGIIKTGRDTQTPTEQGRNGGGSPATLVIGLIVIALLGVYGYYRYQQSE